MTTASNDSAQHTWNLLHDSAQHTWNYSPPPFPRNLDLLQGLRVPLYLLPQEQKKEGLRSPKLLLSTKEKKVLSPFPTDFALAINSLALLHEKLSPQQKTRFWSIPSTSDPSPFCTNFLLWRDSRPNLRHLSEPDCFLRGPISLPRPPFRSILIWTQI